MVDTTLIDEIKSSLKAQQLRNAAKKCYSKKIKSNPEFYEAEKEHQDFYKENSEQPYCNYVITPKLSKLRKLHADKLK